jgi:hypothetical protein
MKDSICRILSVERANPDAAPAILQAPVFLAWHPDFISTTPAWKPAQKPIIQKFKLKLV